MNKELLIIVPAYNESGTIEKLIKNLTSEEIKNIADYVIINDGSSDDTASKAEELGASVISQLYNMGYGCALWTGYKYAAAAGYKYLIQMDADGQHDISNVVPLYERLKTGEADIVIGSRFVEGAAEYHMGGVRRFAVRLFSSIIKQATGHRVTDPTSGLQGLNADVFTFYSQFGNFDDRYPDANMLMQMLLLGYRVEEIPAVMHMRTSGKAMHSGLKPVVYMIRMVISLITVWSRIKIFGFGKKKE